MNMNILSMILSNPNTVSFAISLGASVTWDELKRLAITNRKENSSEYTILCVFEETFKKFYSLLDYEFDSQVVMNEFISQIKKLNPESLMDVDASIIKHVVYPKSLSDFELELFISCLCNVLSQPKYNSIRHEIELKGYIGWTVNPDYNWMTEYMMGNWCKIDIPDTDTLYEILDRIKTSLEDNTWSRIKDYIVEIIINAQMHGHAKKCKLRIDTDTISVIDDGVAFDSLKLKESTNKGGGTLAYILLIEAIPNLNIEYSYKDNLNTLRMVFDNTVFDINRLSEIEVSSLVVRAIPVFLFRGQYKYCFVDMNKALEYSQKRISISGIVSFIDGITLFKKSNLVEKVFLFFPNNNSPIFNELYVKIERSLRFRESENIKLIPERQNDSIFPPEL